MRFNVEIDDMYRAYEDCRRRKKNKRGAKRFSVNALYNIVQLVEEINSGNYRLMPSTCFVVKYPTPREVFCAAFRDRIVQHFVYNELNPLIERKLIHDTCSCRKKKGTDYAIHKVERGLRKVTNNYQEDAFSLKLDLSGFFMAIDRDILLDKIVTLINTEYKGKYKDVLLYLAEIIIKTDCTLGAIKICPESDWELIPPRKTLFGNPNGLAIGNITSQMFANFYLNDIDHFLKSRHSVVVRYVDDTIVLDKSKEKLEETLALLTPLLGTINQKVNVKKTQMRHVKYGVKFLGIKIKPYYSCMDKSRINRMYFSSRKLKTKTDVESSIASRKGMFSRYNGYRVSRRWFMSLPYHERINYVGYNIIRSKPVKTLVRI